MIQAAPAGHGGRLPVPSRIDEPAVTAVSIGGKSARFQLDQPEPKVACTGRSEDGQTRWFEHTWSR